ncbi:MAG: hypothetical protein NTW74_13185, partial [Acidobacteria bacterium]|nr:hypothetical protein [Acidobacteriota bacterium]
IDGISAKALLGGAIEGARKTTYASAGYGEIDRMQLKKTEGEDALHTRVFDQEMKETHKTAMIREGEWKLILNETRGPELYQLKGHSHEVLNVAEAKAHAGVRRDLERKLQSWWAW